MGSQRGASLSLFTGLLHTCKRECKGGMALLARFLIRLPSLTPRRRLLSCLPRTWREGRSTPTPPLPRSFVRKGASTYPTTPNSPSSHFHYVYKGHQSSGLPSPPFSFYSLPLSSFLFIPNTSSSFCARPRHFFPLLFSLSPSRLCVRVNF